MEVITTSHELVEINSVDVNTAEITTTEVVVLSTDVIEFVDVGTQGPRGPMGFSGNILEAVSNSSTTQQVLDTFSYTTYGSAKYIIYATVGTTRQICELLVLHDNISPVLVEYANMVTSSLLATFEIELVDGFVRLLTTPVVPSINFKIYRTLLPA